MKMAIIIRQVKKKITGLGVRRGFETKLSCLMLHEPQEVTSDRLNFIKILWNSV